MLIGASPTDSTGNAAVISEAPFLSIAPSNQPSTNGAGQASCPGCGSPLNEDVGMETTREVINVASSTIGPLNAAQTNTHGSMYGGGPSTVPAGSSMTATSIPTIHGPYLTSSSETMKVFSQTMALGLILTVGAALAML